MTDVLNLLMSLIYSVKYHSKMEFYALILITVHIVSSHWCFAKNIELSPAISTLKNPRQSGQLSKKLFHEGTFVGFSAFTQFSQTLDVDGTVIFGGILLNEGNNYNPSTGTFTCPFTGVYFISVTIRQNDDEGFRFMVVKGTDEVMTLHRETNYGWDTVNNNVLVSCNQLELISVKSDYDASGVYGEDNVPYSLFSVMLMYAPEPINPFHEGFQGATAYNTETQTYTYGDVIQLSSTLYNPDNDYNPIGSYFRCPVEGIYLVAMTLYRDNLYPLRVCVEKTGFLVPIMHVESRTEVSSTSILSNSVLVRCSPGEDISVTATGDGSVKVTNDWVMNTMSVMLMHEDVSSSKYHTTFLGFSGWKRGPQSYTFGETVTFESIILNEGNAYDVTDSTFQCPTLGVYFIMANFRIHENQPLNINIVRETYTIARLSSLGSYAEDVVSGSIMTRCFPGEIISIKGAGSGEVYGDESRAFTTLSIMLLYEY